MRLQERHQRNTNDRIKDLIAFILKKKRRNSRGRSWDRTSTNSSNNNSSDKIQDTIKCKKKNSDLTSYSFFFFYMLLSIEYLCCFCKQWFYSVWSMVFMFYALWIFSTMLWCYCTVTACCYFFLVAYRKRERVTEEQLNKK